MGALNYSYSSGVVIDVCPRGDGLWFDHRELEKIQAFHEHWNAKVAEDIDQIRNLLASEDALSKSQAKQRMAESASRFGIITRAGMWLAGHLD